MATLTNVFLVSRPPMKNLNASSLTLAVHPLVFIMQATKLTEHTSSVFGLLSTKSLNPRIRSRIHIT